MTNSCPPPMRIFTQAPAGLIIPSARLIGLLYERSSLFAFCRLGGTLRLIPERWCTVTVPDAYGRRQCRCIGSQHLYNAAHLYLTPRRANLNFRFDKDRNCRNRDGKVYKKVRTVTCLILYSLPGIHGNSPKWYGRYRVAECDDESEERHGQSI
jgi:hypothetical protein